MDTNVINTQLKKYVYAYTNGVISAQSEIRVYFNNSVVGDSELFQEKKSTFKFKPAIAGKMHWERNNTLVFVPDEPLKRNTSYTASINLKKIIPQMEDEADDNLVFSFKTVDLNFSFYEDEMEFYRSNSDQMVTLKGSFKANDIIALDDMQKMIKFPVESDQVEWFSNDKGTVHFFSIKNMKLTEEEQVFKFTSNPQVLDINQDKESYTILIPPKGPFALVKVIQDPISNQNFKLVFSDEVLANQNLNGLISIKNKNIPLEFDVQGNTIQVFPKRKLNSEEIIQVSTGLKSSYGEQIKEEQIWDLIFKSTAPEIKFSGSGSIASDPSRILIPFEAINLNKVDLEIFKIYDNNILQFLQTNNLNGNYDLQRVGKIEYTGSVSLSDLNSTALQSTWTNYAIDLSNFIQQEPQAIYQVRLGFRPGYVATGLPNADNSDWTDYEKGLTDENESMGSQRYRRSKSIMNYYYGSRGYYNGYRWDHRDDSNYPEYYNSDRFISKNILSSDVGIIAKKTSSNTYLFTLSNLNTTAAVGNQDIVVYNYQQQPIAKLTTDGQGMAVGKDLEAAFVAVVEGNGHSGFIKLDNNTVQSTASFDVSGVVNKDGFKGMFYGERGVWRPGDSLFMNFILEDPDNKLPDAYPVSFEFFDPKGTMIHTQVITDHVNGIYPIHLYTAPEDITGTYRIIAKVGQSKYTKYLRIETIKPNRLKIKFDLPEILTATNDPINTPLQVNWLHGAPGANLKTKVELQLSAAATQFKGYPDYVFTDRNRSVPSYNQLIFNQAVDAQGQGKINKKIWDRSAVPGKMQARFKITAFEDGGNFSVSTLTRPYSPYTNYVGLGIPKTEWGYNKIEIGRSNTIDVVCLSDEGKAQANQTLQYSVYKVSWSWWWSRNNSNTNYINRSSTTLHKSGEITTNSKGKGDFNVSVETWGRYMIRVCDGDGHCATDFVYAGSPYYDKVSDNEEIAQLNIQLDQKTYEPGQTINMKIEGAENAKFLINIEKAGEVLSSTWQNAQAGLNTITLKAESEWAPNVYASVYLIQGNQVKNNDRPIRMFGIIPIMVEDPATKLAPKIEVVDQIEPLQNFEVKVSESNGKAMAYTLAIVDEGLLDITNFKTPDPWSYFYQKEALGVKSYDIYNQVIGRFTGEMSNILAVGGGLELAEAEIDKKEANRFKPVVMTAGPFYLKKGASEVHNFTMPNYLGSVKVMVVAVDQSKYGATDKTIKVNQPVMVLSTLPRVLGTKEKLDIPVTVFNNTDKQKQIDVSISATNGLVQFAGAKSQTVTVDALDNQVVYFPIELSDEVGVATFNVQARSGSNKGTQETEIAIRNPNPIQYTLEYVSLQEGESNTFDYLPKGTKGTNTVSLEISNFPDLNIKNRLSYLIRYPYGCLEQTTSSVFPQLYLADVLDLNKAKEKEIKANIQAGIKRLNKFLTPKAGFSYWPGQHSYRNSWANTYAGHFLVEAKRKGYTVPGNLYNSWLRYTKRAVQSWSTEDVNSAYAQSYALYVLALAGEADLAAMNRLKESGTLQLDDLTLLAGAYMAIGQKEIGAALLSQAQWHQMSKDSRRNRYYGSLQRDQAILLMVQLQDDPKSKQVSDLAKHLATALNSRRYFNTQAIAMTLNSLGQFMEINSSKQSSKFTYSQNKGKNTQVEFEKNATFIDDLQPTAGTINIKNTGGNTLYVNLIQAGKPSQEEEEPRAENISIAVSYVDQYGQEIDPQYLSMGTEFYSKVTVKHNGVGGTFTELALNQTFPSGWEIVNERMDNMKAAFKSSRYTFKDIRDDKVFTFFNLGSRSTVTYYTKLIATYAGEFYLPATSCSSMYRDDIFANNTGKWVQVLAESNQ